MDKWWLIHVLSVLSVVSVTLGREKEEQYRLPAYDEIVEGLEQWQKQRPDCMQIEVLGESVDGRAMLLCHITDLNIPDKDKQSVLIYTAHAAEVHGPLQVLYTMKWLLGDAPLAVETRRRQHILLMPVAHPDAYVYRSYGPRDYSAEAIAWDGTLDVNKYPEGDMFAKVVKKYQPEVLINVHSTGNQKDVFMSESIGFSGSSYTRPFNLEVKRRMCFAAEQGGYNMSYSPQSAGKIRVTAQIPGANERYGHSGKMYYRGTSDWAYHAHHALGIITETHFQESFCLAMQELFRIGHDTWQGERYNGYPVNQVAMVGATGLSAWGNTAVERRASRCELWKNIGHISCGVLYPERKGRQIAFFCSDPALRQRLKVGAETLDGTWQNFLANLEKERIADGYNLNNIKERIGPTWPKPATVWLQGGEISQCKDPIIHNGLNIRLFIPYLNPLNIEVLLDGNKIEKSPIDGYTIYHCPGTIIEVCVPPGKTKPLHVVSASYDVDVVHKEGFSVKDWELK
jgi:hypothetical protein